MLEIGRLRLVQVLVDLDPGVNATDKVKRGEGGSGLRGGRQATSRCGGTPHAVAAYQTEPLICDAFRLCLTYSMI